jgi:hypothetical protein
MNMRMLGLGLLLALPFAGACVAKSETERIEVSRGKMQVASIDGAAAERITIWSGPGTRMTLADGTSHMTVTPGDFADWKGGAVNAPPGQPVYSVSFFCKACEPARRDTWRCYGVRYVPGRDGERGYIEIPKPGDDEYETNVRTIYRGVEGRWFRATESWDALMRAHLAPEREVKRAAAAPAK